MYRYSFRRGSVFKWSMTTLQNKINVCFCVFCPQETFILSSEKQFFEMHHIGTAVKLSQLWKQTADEDDKQEAAEQEGDTQGFFTLYGHSV